MPNTNNPVFEKKPSERSFGIVFSVVFLIIALYPLLDSQPIYLWSLIVSIALLFVAFVFPKLLTVANNLWFKLGIALGSIVSPLVMALIYFLVVLPTGIVMRALGKDLLRQKLDKNAHSYWIERNEPTSSMKNQF